MKKLRLLLSISCLLSTVSAQSDLIRPGSIGQPTATPSCEFSANNQPPATCWVGQKIIFLPRPKSLQGYGYQSFSGGTGQFGNVSYNEGVGKIATIIEVKDGQYSGYEVKVKIDSSDKIYTGKTYGDKTQPASIDGVAFIREIQDARTNLTGKTVWLSVDSVATYDNSTGKISNINVKKFQPLKIEDVVAGWYSETPIQLIIRLPDGREAFTNISYYGWNAGSLKQRFAFERSVFLEDPKTLHKWTENIWAALEDNKILPGMTQEQVYFSRTQGFTTNKSVTSQGQIEQWTYKGYGIVTFIDGIVSSFTELK